MLELLVGPLDLLVLDGPGHFAFVPETLEDGVEPHLLLLDLGLEVGLRLGRGLAEGTLGAFAALVGVKGVLPLVDALGFGGDEHK